jgi:hypothetical protein
MISRNNFFIIYFSLALSFMGGCKASNWSKKNGDKERTAPAIAEPQRLGTADLEAAKSPAVFELDSEFGRIKSVLVLRLDYFPRPITGSATLPVCLSPLAGDFVVGIAECLDNIGITKPVLAKNVDQACYTNETIGRVSAKSPMVIPGCTKAMAVAHKFEPNLMLDVELR